MTIAFDVSHIQRHRAGIGAGALALLHALTDHDRVNHYVLHGWSSSLDCGALRRIQHENVSLRIARVPGPIKRLYWDRIPFPALETLIGRCDIFHSSDASFPPVSRARLLLTVHDITSLTHPEFHVRAVTDRDRRLVARLGRADGVIVPSTATRDALLHAGACSERRIHIHTPVVPSFCTPAEQPGESALLAPLGITRPYILYVGTIEPRKNIRGIVEAFDQINRQRGNDMDLVLAGKIGWKSEPLLAAIAGAASASRIRVLSYVPDETLAVLYRHALCLIYPSFAEGYGLPVAEAIASGLPVVTSIGSPMAEIAGDAANLVDPHSAADIADAVLRMTSSGTELARWKSRARDRAKVSAASCPADAMLALYADLGAS
jgi:glycosyltransferase involved in cell wall biosynthesis